MPQPSANRSGPEDGAVAYVAKAAPAEADALLRFDPERVIRGIRFHLIDQGIAREVHDASAQRALARLRRAGCAPAIRRSVWAAMGDDDRLEWLLAVSGTLPLVREDDVVLLSSKDIA